MTDNIIGITQRQRVLNEMKELGIEQYILDDERDPRLLNERTLIYLTKAMHTVLGAIPDAQDQEQLNDLLDEQEVLESLMVYMVN